MIIIGFKHIKLSSSDEKLKSDCDVSLYTMVFAVLAAHNIAFDDCKFNAE